jgi:hypothetical protein
VVTAQDDESSLPTASVRPRNLADAKLHRPGDAWQPAVRARHPCRGTPSHGCGGQVMGPHLRGEQGGFGRLGVLRGYRESPVGLRLAHG